MSTRTRGNRGLLVAGLPMAIGLALAATSPILMAQATTADAAKKADPTSTDDAAAAKKAADAQAVKDIEAVNVSGYRASLDKALDLKRASTGAIDAIVAEDIANFPDLNLAESLQRVPGVAITRDAGEGRNISVRGLDSQFTRVRINGMEALTTAGGTDSSGGANRGRGFDFNVFASELFSNITVRKTAAAQVEEGSLGATVDLRAARPFDYDGFTFVTSAQLGWNDLAEKTNPRIAALISNTWGDDKFGALLSLAYTERDIREEGHSTVRWDNGTSSGGFSAASPYAPARLATTFHPRIPRYGVLTHEQERLGITGALQFKLSDSTSFNFDAMYSKFDAKRTEDFLEAISFSRTGTGKPQTIVRDGQVDANGSLVYGLFDNVDIRSESRYDELSTEFKQFTLTGEHFFEGGLHISGLAGYSKSTFDNPIQTTVTIDRNNTNGYSYDYRGDNREPIINYGFDVTNPANWIFANGSSEIRLRPQATSNIFKTGQLDAQWDFDDTFTFKGGLNWKEYEFSSFEARRASETSVPALPAGTALGSLTRIVTGPSGQTWLAPSVDAFATLFNIYGNSGTFFVSDQVASVRGNNRGVIETDKGAYLQADFRSEWFGIPVRGDLGVRYVRTEQESRGFAIVNNAPIAVVANREYSDTLPSINLVADLSDDFLVRVGWAKVMARPGLGNLTPGVTVAVSGGARTVTGGDPFLDPFRATTFDLGFEWYFAENSLLSVAYFHKDIESFVQTSRETRPYNTSGLPVSLLAGTGASPTDDFQFNIPLNTPGGALKGLEFNYQTPLTFISPKLKNFGVLFNYTYVASKIQYLTAAGAASLNTDLTGLSENSVNGTFYYENEKFSARISGAYRDDYLTTVPGRNNADVEGTKGTLTVDLSTSWKFNDKMEFTLEALNLTDEYSDQWVDSRADRASVYHHTGREVYVGVRYKF